MKNIEYTDLVTVLQESFEEDLSDNLDEDGNFFPVNSSEHELSSYLLSKIYDSFDPDASNEEKLDAFFTVLEDLRDVIQGVEQTLDNWEEVIVDGSESE